MSGITTHVLDTSTGRPAQHLAVVLWHGDDEVARGRTDTDGRWGCEQPQGTAGTLRLEFATGDYFGGMSFHPRVSVEFHVVDPAEPLHVPLLLSPFGYTTYRGS